MTFGQRFLYLISSIYLFVVYLTMLSQQLGYIASNERITNA
jgi:hypothetical protein